MTNPLTAVEVSETASWIASVQLRNGMIPWFPGGHADPWNHTEAAMAMVLAGRRSEADRAFEWLASSQLPDGTWCRYYLADGVEDPRRDPNLGAYAATGAWRHYLRTRDLGFLEGMWPVVDKAIAFVLRLQQPGGQVLWSMDPNGHPGRYALLTSTCSILHSVRAAVGCEAELPRTRASGVGARGRPDGRGDSPSTWLLRSEGPLGHGLVLPHPGWRVDG